MSDTVILTREIETQTCDIMTNYEVGKWKSTNTVTQSSDTVSDFEVGVCSSTCSNNATQTTDVEIMSEYDISKCSSSCSTNGTQTMDLYDLEMRRPSSQNEAAMIEVIQQQIHMQQEMQQQQMEVQHEMLAQIQMQQGLQQQQMHVQQEMQQQQMETTQQMFHWMEQQRSDERDHRREELSLRKQEMNQLIEAAATQKLYRAKNENFYSNDSRDSVNFDDWMKQTERDRFDEEVLKQLGALKLTSALQDSRQNDIEEMLQQTNGTDGIWMKTRFSIPEVNELYKTRNSIDSHSMSDTAIFEKSQRAKSLSSKRDNIRGFVDNKRDVIMKDEGTVTDDCLTLYISPLIRLNSIDPESDSKESSEESGSFTSYGKESSEAFSSACSA